MATRGKSDARDRAVVQALLEKMNLRVQALPEGDVRTPDFVVDGDERGYLVEIKTRFDDAHYNKALREENVALQSRSMGFSKWTDNVVHEAVHQFAEFDKDHSRWWVPWIMIRCKAARQAMFLQVLGSLFGVRQIVYTEGESTDAKGRDCLFVLPGVFERHPQVDGVVVSAGGARYLSVNCFAEDPGGFKESRLGRAFADINAMYTRQNLTENQGFFEVDCASVDRRSEDSIRAHLASKYDLTSVIVCDMKQHEAVTWIPDSAVEDKKADDKPQV